MSTTDLVAIEPLLPIDPEQARVAMAKYRDLTAAMLTAEDWQQIPGGRFVKRSGFQKIASGYGVSTEIVHEHVDRDKDTGEPIRASAVVRATHPTGRYAEGSGRCSITESRFGSAKGRAKAEHDIAATAVTRATNRAISNLVGFGQVSAEEMDGVAPDAAHAQPYGLDGDAETDAQVEQNIAALYPGVDGHVFVQFFLRQLKVEHVPQASARMLSAIQWALGDARVAKPVDAEAVPDEPDARVADADADRIADAYADAADAAPEGEVMP
jgi:hypothetical protein